MQEQEVMTVISHSHSQTQELGMRLGELLRGGELLLLEGQLGMGKTTFTQGIARGMGIRDVINSPTFTLLKEYPGLALPVSSTSTLTSSSAGVLASRQDYMGKRSKRAMQSKRGPALYHFDLYRLDDPEEMYALGFDDYFSDPSGVCVIEWADRAEGLWPRERLDILLRIVSETGRSLTFTASGSRYYELLQQFQKSTYAIIGS